MVAAFSVGLALTLIIIGITVAWGLGKVLALSPDFDRWAQRLPYVSAAFVMIVGLALAAAGLSAGLNGPRKPS